MITFDGWFTLVVVVVMFVALAKEVLSTEAIMFSALVALWTKGVVSTGEALSGYSNPQVLAVALLFIVSAGMRETGGMNAVTKFILGKEFERKSVLVRMLVPAAGLSGFFNNTPIVAMLAPAVRDWAVRNGRAPSRFLLPLSYATMLGGTCTLIGTASNLIISGMLEEAGHPPLSMFEITPLGLSVTLAGLIFLFLFSAKLLPDRRSPEEMITENAREYSVTLEVQDDSSLIGKTVEEGGLRQLRGLFLAEIERGPDVITPIRREQKILQGDRLTFFGAAETVVDLQRIKGLQPVSESGDVITSKRANYGLFEVVVSANSPLVGRTLKDANFRRRYDAAVVALHRGGERVRSKLGDVKLRAGDTLMVQAAKGFRATWGSTRDFYLVARIEDFERPRYERAPHAIIISAMMIVAMSTGIMPTVMAAAVASILMVLTGCLSSERARSSLDLSVIIVIASSFGISKAVVNSGLADLVAQEVIGSVAVWGPMALLVVLYLVSTVITELLSNSAAAALLVPVALSTAQMMDSDPRPYIMVVCISAATSFIVPFSYQTNLMVYGPGGYRFSDFVRIGVPMTLIMFIVTMIVVPLVYM